MRVELTRVSRCYSNTAVADRSARPAALPYTPYLPDIDFLSVPSATAGDASAESFPSQPVPEAVQVSSDVSAAGPQQSFTPTMHQFTPPGLTDSRLDLPAMRLPLLSSADDRQTYRPTFTDEDQPGFGSPAALAAVLPFDQRQFTSAEQPPSRTLTGFLPRDIVSWLDRGRGWESW